MNGNNNVYYEEARVYFECTLNFVKQFQNNRFQGLAHEFKKKKISVNFFKKIKI